jgi:hypothetical protein
MPIVKIPDCGRGVNLDLTPEELQAGMWSDCRNMRFKDGYAQRFGGMAQIFDTPTTDLRWITAYQTATKRFFVTAGTDRVFADDGTTRTEITRLAEPIEILSITRTSATLATLKTKTAHGRTTGDLITVYGATPDAFNVTAVVATVTAADTFTYALTTDPGTSASVVGHLIGPGAAVEPFTGGIDDRWTGGVIGGILIMNNGIDPPQYWAGDDAKLRTLPGWDSTWRAQVMVVFKQYILALGVSKDGVMNPNMVKWSTSAVPGAIPTSWNETDLTLDAGEVDIAETPDLLVDALQLGDALVVYKQRSAYVIRLIGQPFIFQIQRLPGDSGMLFRGCAANTPLGHVVLTSGDVVINNGQGMQSVADGWVRRYLNQNIDSVYYKRAFVTVNPQENEVLVCIPEAGQTACSLALVWNWKDKTWGKRDLHNATFGAVGQISGDAAFSIWDNDNESWELDSTTWNEDEYAPNEARLLLCETGRIVAFDVSSSDDGVNPLPGMLERTGIWLDDSEVNKLLKAVYPRIDGPSQAQVSLLIGAAMVADSIPAWSDAIPFIVGRDMKADGFAKGRYLAVRLECSDPWRMRSLNLDVVPAGYH